MANEKGLAKLIIAKRIEKTGKIPTREEVSRVEAYIKGAKTTTPTPASNTPEQEGQEQE